MKDVKRPVGIRLLSFVLGWLAIGGFGNAWISLTPRASGLPSWFGGIALCYGVTAALACVGLWRMRRWTILAMRAWMGVCGTLLIGFIAVFPSRTILGGYWGVLAFCAVLSALFFSMDRYVCSWLSSGT
jgi:hypothetical protein